MSTRIIIDVSTLSRWAGPPVGIVRVDYELVRWARANIPGVTFAFFDPQNHVYRTVKDEWIEPLLARGISVNPWIAPSTRMRRRRSDRIPGAIKPALMWVFQLRRNLLMALERIRLSTADRKVAAWVDRLQRPLITRKNQPYFFGGDGGRKSMIDYEHYLGPPAEFGPGDTLVCAGAPWEHSDIDVIEDLKRRFGIRTVVVCYDIIPLLFPEFFRPSDVDAFKHYFLRALPLADLVVCNAEVPRQDAIAYCRAQGLGIGETCIVPLGADGAAESAINRATAALPEGLTHGKYAIFISTIEPRKNHRLLYNVWLRLLAEGLPQKTGFKLVFVGRPGWMVDDLLAQLKNDERLAGSFMHLTFVPDDQLAALYEGAAFCLYPSVYEGYGLPVIEAFLRGKAVLASTGGALPEVVDGLSPCLDPHDEAAWHDTLVKWIADPSARAPYEAAIRSRFRPTTWNETAQRFFAAVGRLR